MKKIKIVLTLALGLGLGSGGLNLAQKTPSVSAATYRVVKTTSMPKTAYHRASNKGAIYNLSHTKKIASLKTYPNTTWYATQRVTLKHGNSQAVYYRVKNQSGAVKGYVWHKYLKAGVAPFNLKYAKAAVALNADTNQVLWAKNANTPRAVASIAKLMTLYLVLQKINEGNGSWTSRVNTSYSGLKAMGKSSVYGGFKFRQNSYTVRQLYQAALVGSSNNAATALGQWVAGGATPAYNAKFIKLMNRQAAQWRLSNTVFVSASGMEQNALRTYGYSVKGGNANLISAKNVALIASHLVGEYPDVLTDASRQSLKVTGQSLHNYNYLLPGRKYYQPSLKVDGLKTGYTGLAGYCFVGTGQKVGHARLITVVLHDENEFTETRSLMNYVYRKDLL